MMSVLYSTLSVCLCLSVFVHLSIIHPSVCLSVHPSICLPLSIRPSVCLPVYQSFCMSISLYPTVLIFSVCVCLPVCLSVSLSVCSVCQGKEGGSRSTVVMCWTAGQQVECQSCTSAKIHTHIHLISPRCPRSNLALQIKAQNTVDFISICLYLCLPTPPPPTPLYD